MFTRACVKNKKSLIEKGQALVELAVFGAFLIMILSVLINYGLKYNLQQKASMIAYRRALKIASDPERGTGTYMLMQERHIPEATDMFGLGSKMPISASASVTRDVNMHAQPSDINSLSAAVMDIQTKREGNSQTWIRMVPKMSGFRLEYGVPSENVPKYKLIYGAVVAKEGPAIAATGYESGSFPPKPAGPRSGWTWVSVNSDAVQRSCITSHMEPIYDGYGNQIGQNPVCDQMAIAVLRIVDSCVGESINYNSCYIQSRKLVDVAFCTSECIRTEGEDCAATCALKTLPPNQDDPIYSDSNGGGAWYASDSVPESCVRPDGSYDTCYTFPILLDKLFAFTGGAPAYKIMGMQGDSVSQITRTENSTKHETDTAFLTTASVTTNDTTQKSVLGHYGLDAEGYDQENRGAPENYVNVISEDLDTTVIETVNENWQTSK